VCARVCACASVPLCWCRLQWFGCLCQNWHSCAWQIRDLRNDIYKQWLPRRHCGILAKWQLQHNSHVI